MPATHSASPAQVQTAGHTFQGADSPDTAGPQAAPVADSDAPAPAPRRRGRPAGAQAGNKGKAHDVHLRQLVWDCWERTIDGSECSNDLRGLRSDAALPLLTLICEATGVGGKSKFAFCRRWIGRKIQDPEYDLTRNSSGAGGATESHPYPPVTRSMIKQILGKIKQKRTGSSRRTLSFVNGNSTGTRRKIRSKQTILNVVKKKNLHWAMGKDKHHQAGQHEVDKPIRIRFCQQMKANENRLKKIMAMSDEKIFALSETHGGGCWCEEGEEPPHQSMWQSDAKWHVWGGICWEGTLPLIFLEGGTFKGERTWQNDWKKLLEKKAKQKRKTKITKKQRLAVGHSYNRVLDVACKDLQAKYGNVQPVWQQDGAKPHWTGESMDKLAEYGYVKTNSMQTSTVCIEEERQSWPARCPDLNWMDEFVWGIMVNNMRFRDVTTKEGLKRAIKAEWAKITPQMCQNMITHYWKAGGTLDKCLEAGGGRFSKPKLSVVNDDEEA
jgi:hypothetical protein